MKHDRFFQERLDKLEKIKKLGFHSNPERFERTHLSTEAIKLGETGVREVEEIASDIKKDVVLCGRMMSFRSFGKLTFSHILDSEGKIQICFMKGLLSEKEEQLVKLLDIGDFIGITGELFKTKHGEITLLVSELTFLGKALRPLPEKFHGIKDQEIKYRQRYLDIMMDNEAKKKFDLRFKVLRKLREFYWDKGFNEIETPILENISSGASARPFTTHHNSLDIDVYLRIAAGELWQKTAIIGGYEKTFEVARCFRNEGMDPSHLQEFTMIEHYAAYWNFEDNMKFTEEMFEYLMKEVIGTTKVTVLDRENNPVEIDFKTPWPRKDYREMIKKDCGIDILDYDNAKDLLNVIKGGNIQIDEAETMGYGNLVDHLYKKVSRPKLIQPCFVIKHPADTKPLARRNDEDGRVCDTFQLLVNTWEIVNAYSELVDPVDQRDRLERQSDAKAKGDEDSMEMNEEYLTAMEHGMPPISGWGLGIDRIVALLTQQDNLRDTVLFPLLRPINDESKKNVEEKIEKIEEVVNKIEKIEAGISYEDAKKLLDENVKDPVIKNHSREAEVVMRALAKHFGENEEVWGIAGLLHDVDFDKTKNDIENHGVLCKSILKDAGVSDALINVITSHVAPERNTRFEHALAAGETITGLIYSYGLMRPDKKLENVEVKSIRKKFKDKSFAAKVNRETILECEQIGLELNDFLEISLGAMKGIAGEIGL